MTVQFTVNIEYENPACIVEYKEISVCVES